MSEKTDYRAIVERIAEILHGSVTDVDLLTITVQAMKERNKKLERQRRLTVESNSGAMSLKTSAWMPAAKCEVCVEGARGGCSTCAFNRQ
ncbi:hypothetical protein SNN58_001707 [Cronobacter dublinensis]|nr:hypothetical protein [Cronobacter dublinensis]ELY3971129.1 hypothetical protein [Cronobacter dublinensis]ELY4485770.1 hypothetical protein [Cronobacter dublinensis]ELY5823221.1 hypothetical protein [Cronobacter dublinensis]